ncbi:MULTISPECIES: transcriptional regulator [unclassified Methanoculleus]|uniref:transcriptional regulator n=2 Tax=Methanoculleus TaxID=45989 RepID=UPI0025DA3A47|nr:MULTISPECIES: transcriptional regulator [unclassified Methanoculleus]MDD2252803.1 transcriptional regulator [Methanoculleus sp.]MDD2787566.1 transcriptional regulator [Methanoculleus sp.]MDD3215214.1 transcriptional regulator [Methanoculleus sp.]MDD4313046.1 transcriptional regulator [Methanoculleus sp.]MDD4471741.1 transcriptional regulator [Methanoculleus sp.]
MTQDRLPQMVISIMLLAGFDVSERCNIRPRSFDLIAKKSDTLVIIKVAPHIDGVSADIARDLNLIARHLQATPLIVGERARDTELERGVVYIRYGLFALSPETLYDYFAEGLSPMVYASPGGLYVKIKGDLLREVRERSRMSLGDLASHLGVSRRTISKYESGMGTTLDIAIRLEELFSAQLVETIELVDYRSPEPEGPPESATGDVLVDLERMGMEIHAMRQAPFQALALFEKHTILTAYGTSQKVVKRASLIGNISQITKTFAMCVVTDYKKQKKIGKTLLIGEKHLHTLEDGSELIDMINE